MKLTTTILLLLTTCSSFSQLQRIEEVPVTRIFLNREWKFQAGDNNEWASPFFNDKTWQSIDPSKTISKLPEVREAQVGWFRYKLYTGKALQGKAVNLYVTQLGASEIYLNGKLIQQYGEVSIDPDTEKTFNPVLQPIPVLFAADSIQVFAVRYSFSRRNWYPAKLGTTFSLAITATADAWNETFYRSMTSTVTYTIAAGVFLIMFLLHVFLYISYPSRKVNLYISIFTFCQLIFVLRTTLRYFSHSATTTFLWETSYVLLWPLSWVFYLFCAYELFHQKKNTWFKATVALMLSYIPEYYLSSEYFDSLYGYSLLTIICISILRISMIAIRKKMIGARFFFTGQIVFTVSLLLVIGCRLLLFGSGGFYKTVFVIAPLLVWLTPCICVSFILALEVATTNHSLKLQLENVNKLSRQTIEQEKEKQQILSSLNETLENQVQERTAELEQSLEDLKSAQSQLIQSEKMASLGELTAGIAHEIQNPLNFVNNFSEVSTELVDEMNTEIDKGNTKDAKQIALDLKQNLEKINHHGKRAGDIVKGMLQHSRSSSGVKEPTDINVLADEYLRLAYHGLRAKDKSFNATMKTDFDESIGNINIIPQDIGRVILNLITNAFYAVNEKARSAVATPAAAKYEPTVSVSTKKINDKVEIKVRDNGNGISQKILDKIFQPFFTTKPTGQGTGLGLSLSYDIVKAHSGELKVETKEGEGTTFKIVLPYSA